MGDKMDNMMPTTGEQIFSRLRLTKSHGSSRILTKCFLQGDENGRIPTKKSFPPRRSAHYLALEASRAAWYVS